MDEEEEIKWWSKKGLTGDKAKIARELRKGRERTIDTSRSEYFKSQTEQSLRPVSDEMMTSARFIKKVRRDNRLPQNWFKLDRSCKSKPKSEEIITPDRRMIRSVLGLREFLNAQQQLTEDEIQETVGRAATKGTQTKTKEQAEMFRKRTARWKCNDCGKEYIKRDDFRDHRQRKHPRNRRRSDETEINQSRDRNRRGGKKRKDLDESEEGQSDTDLQTRKTKRRPRHGGFQELPMELTFRNNNGRGGGSGRSGAIGTSSPDPKGKKEKGSGKEGLNGRYPVVMLKRLRIKRSKNKDTGATRTDGEKRIKHKSTGDGADGTEAGI